MRFGKMFFIEFLRTLNAPNLKKNRSYYMDLV